MSNAQYSHPSYYLAIEGEQVGPISEEDVLNRIEAGLVDQETLVWSEGMDEWAPLTALAVFQAKFKSQAAHQDASVHALGENSGIFSVSQMMAAAKQTAEQQQQRGQKKPEPKRRGEEMAPVFSGGQARIGDSDFLKTRVATVAIGLCLLAAATGIYFYFGASTDDMPQKAANIKARKMKSPEGRQLRLNKAQSEVLTEAEASVAELKRLVSENPNDDIAKQASLTLVDYFRSTQRYADAGRVLLQIKDPAGAARMFSQDPNTKKDAEEAYFQAFQTAQDLSQKRSYLQEDIALLIGPLSQTDKAVERIRLYVTTFPNEPHPYGYYLQSTDERISGIFSKISFHFVQGLLSYFDTELAQVTLMSRPLVEVKKTKTHEYRVVGTYRGDVLLNKERMKDIYFTFWMVGDRWVLVDTNMTLERKRWAQREREKLKDTVVSGDLMLKQLEQAFRTQFPRNGLHEKVGPQTETAKPKQDDGF